MSAAARAEMTMSDDRAVRVWASVGQQAEGRRPSVTYVCAAAVARVGVDGVGLSIMVSPILRETRYSTDRTATEREDLQLGARPIRRVHGLPQDRADHDAQAHPVDPDPGHGRGADVGDRRAPSFRLLPYRSPDADGA